LFIGAIYGQLANIRFDLKVAQGISVWPGYVAAVASLVLSLLLLSGVMVFAITQVGQLVGAYNEDLMLAVVEDEARALEIEKLRAQSRSAEEALARRSRDQEAVVPVSKPLKSQTDLELERLRRLQEQIDQREQDIARLNQELARVQSELRLMASVQQNIRTQTYRFVFGQGMTGLNDAVMSQFMQQIQDDKINPAKQMWVLEAGVMGLDPAVNREVYRLMLNTRKQLELLGFESDRVRVVLNASASPRSMMSDPSSLRPGEVPMLLSTGIKEGGA
jgi:hypothetical protein